MALLADAGHNLGDVLALLLAWGASVLAVRPSSARFTYGLKSSSILAALANAPGRVFTREMLLTRIWGDAAYRDPRTIDVHIRHLREKLERDPSAPELTRTVRGVGYRFGA